MASPRALKYAPWSASKIGSALRCPRLFYYRYVDKLPEPEVSPAARIGKAVHKTLELALVGKPLSQALNEGRTLVVDETEGARFDELGHAVPAFLERIASFRSGRSVGRQYIEYKLAIREDLSATNFYSRDSLFRGVVDAAYVFDSERLAVVDHKTGSRRAAETIAEQLEGYAVLAATQFHHVKLVWLGVHWVADCAMEWAEPITRAEINDRCVPAVLDNIEAAALAVADGPRAEPSFACEYCSYRSICPAASDGLYGPGDEDPEPRG